MAESGYEPSALARFQPDIAGAEKELIFRAATT